MEGVYQKHVADFILFNVDLSALHSSAHKKVEDSIIINQLILAF